MYRLGVVLPQKEAYKDAIEEVSKDYYFSKFYDKAGDFFDKLTRWLERILEKLFGKFDFSPVQAKQSAQNFSGFTMILLLVAVGIGMFFVFKLINNKISSNKKVTEILGQEINQKSSTRGFLEMAKKEKESGDFNTAIHFGYIAILFEMNHTKLLNLGYARTNREMISDLLKKGFTEISAFKKLAGIYNYAWYGEKFIDSNMYEKWEKELATVLKGVELHDQKKK